MGKKHSDNLPMPNTITVIQSYNAVDDKYKNVEFLTVKTIKSSDDMLTEIKEIASKANHNDEIMDVILHTSEQITNNLLEKLKKECENSKKFKKNLHNVQLAFTRSYTQVNRRLASELNDFVGFYLADFALSSLDHVLQTTSTKKNKVMWAVSEKDDLVTSQIKAWATQKELALARLDDTHVIIPTGVTKVYAYVTNNHEAEALIEAMKDNDFKGSLSLIDCSKAFGASNRALLATMVTDGLLEDAVALTPGTKFTLSEQEKQDLNTDKHENCLKATVESSYPIRPIRPVRPIRRYYNN